MAKSVIAYLLLVLAPAVALALFAWRVADQDYEERLRLHTTRLDAEADALHQRIANVVADAAQEGEQILEAIGDRLDPGAVVGFAEEGRFIGYSRGSGGTPSNDNELRVYNLSVQGGESYEFARNDPGRALDAFSFYLPRIQNTELRDRLRFRMARAALSSGNDALGRALLRQLFETNRGSLSEEGYPIDLLAAARLLTVDDGDELATRVRHRLYAARAHLSTPRLARFAAELAPDDRAIARELSGRYALEGAVEKSPEILAERDAVLTPDALLIARTSDAPAVRALCRVPVAVPPLVAGGFQAALEFDDTTDPDEINDDAGILRTSRTLRLDSSATTLAILEVSDPTYSATVKELHERRTLHWALVALLIVLTLGGGAALVFYYVRERRLARLRAQLLANVSQELKTPITSIRMFSELLAESPFDEKRTERFGRLLSSESLRLSRIVDNVLDFSRPGDRQLLLEVEPVDVNVLVGRVVEGFLYRAREDEVAFHVAVERPEGADTADFHVVTNEAAVERILANLLDNALKYRRDHEPEIRLQVTESVERVRLAVVDNGIGVPRADRERIFEEFYRVHYDNYGVPGSGLGLAIAQQLARALGGDITVESTEREGSTFSLDLPRSDGGGDDSAPDEPAATPAVTPEDVPRPIGSETP